MAIDIRVGENIIVETTGQNQSGGVADEVAVSWAGVKEPDPSSSVVTAPSVTTTHAGSMVILVGHSAAATTANPFSGSGSPTERVDENTALGLDATLFIDTYTQAAAGATGARTASTSHTVKNMGATIALYSPSGNPVFGTIGTVAKVASGDLVPGEPSGSSSDDIFICFLVQRDNVVATMDDVSIDPGQWSPIYGVDVVRRAGQELRCSAWWCRRLTDPPDFTITRAGGNAAIAVVISFGNIVDHGSPFDGVATGAKISVLLSGVLTDQLASVKGEFPGSDDRIVYNWKDPFNVAFQTLTPVNVLDVSEIGINPSTLVFDLSDGGTPDPVTLEAFGLDANVGSPRYPLYWLEWSIVGAAVAFTGATLGPTVEIEALADGSATITVTGQNYRGATVTGTLQVTVKGVTTVTVTRKAD